MKSILSIACAAVVTIGATAAVAQPQPYRVVFDLTSQDPLDQQAVLRWIREVTALKPKTETEVVMYGRGLDLVIAGKTTAAAGRAGGDQQHSRQLQGLCDSDGEPAGGPESAAALGVDHARDPSADSTAIKRGGSWRGISMVPAAPGLRLFSVDSEAVGNVGDALGRAGSYPRAFAAARHEAEQRASPP